jgi:NADPH-dependent 2,4-dienoyl-CoA reductase/sulfur reductase-like enzyme/nitrite reductase/ring-hydroxylating ferredoxin subunit
MTTGLCALKPGESTMATSATENPGPDLTAGVTLADFGGRQLLRGHVGKKSVLLARTGDEILAVGAKCTHYSGPLEEGFLIGDTIRCPLHHACFSLRTGEALGAPAFDPLPCWLVERDGDHIVVRERIATAPRGKLSTDNRLQDIVIIGGGAAGFACAEMLRRRGFDGRLTMLSEDDDAPCDRPNLSKDFLAGSAADEWMPLKPEGFYAENRIDLRLAAAVTAIDTAGRKVITANGDSFAFDRLLIATGAEPIQLPIPGSDQSHVFTLRSFADGRAIVERAKAAKSAVVLGSGFIGLEAAAALRERGLEVHVVSLDAQPLEKVLGRQLGHFIRGLHESHGVTFHMDTSIAMIGAETVTLTDGAQLQADLIIIGVGVRPRTALAEAAGLTVDRGIVVNARLETASPGIYAAGDVARWARSESHTMRVEHWVVAERQGQMVAENMLGGHSPFQDTPFFWSAHYDVTIRYVGHAEDWDSIEIDGDIAAHDCTVSYRRNGRVLAVATIGRDHVALERAQFLTVPV